MMIWNTKIWRSWLRMLMNSSGRLGDQLRRLKAILIPLKLTHYLRISLSRITRSRRCWRKSKILKALKVSSKLRNWTQIKNKTLSWKQFLIWKRLRKESQFIRWYLNRFNWRSKWISHHLLIKIITFLMWRTSTKKVSSMSYKRFRWKILINL